MRRTVHLREGLRQICAAWAATGELEGIQGTGEDD
jgi:hypothetical protein